MEMGREKKKRARVRNSKQKNGILNINRGYILAGTCFFKVWSFHSGRQMALIKCRFANPFSILLMLVLGKKIAYNLWLENVTIRPLRADKI
jgi:hypothetical protein